MNKLKILNDPIYGFITISSTLIFDLIEHPYFQRLRRISQMGLSYLVYPGANHTRFQHAIGCMHLMQKAIRVLKRKGVIITEDEEQALQIAILLHDIGHGPFSHAMEHSLVEGVSHETISLKIMEQLNNEFNGQLSTAIQIFKADYYKEYMCQLVSGQLDMDRADYLKRDSFYTGVAEGNINSERLINMLNVVENKLVIEEKGIYSVEKFLLARRLMYWQVYLHKTSLVAEQLLINMFKRAKELKSKNITLPCSKPLLFFLDTVVNKITLNTTTLNHFLDLDDIDIVAAMKQWQYHNDKILSFLCKMILNRQLLKIKLKDTEFNNEKINQKKESISKLLNLPKNEVSYFVFNGSVSNQAYLSNKQQIDILLKNGKVKDITKVLKHFNLKIMRQPTTKYYLVFPK